MNFTKIIFIIARTLDYRIGLQDTDKPELPILTFQEALLSFSFRLFIFIIEFMTCFFVIGNIIHHW
jgi:hypothetical protein